MRLTSLLAFGLAALAVAKDGTTTETTETNTNTDFTSTITGSSTSYNWSDASTITNGSAQVPTGTYLTYTSVITLDNGDHKTVVSSSLNASATATGNQTLLHTSTSDSVTVLVGGGKTTTLGNNSMNATHTHSSTSSLPTQTNTTPCNGYSEFCMRNYSNITNVAAHNSPFVIPGNAASNQALKVTDQLNDGIRTRKSLSDLLVTPLTAPLTTKQSNSKPITRAARSTSVTRAATCSTPALWKPTSLRFTNG